MIIVVMIIIVECQTEGCDKKAAQKLDTIIVNPHKSFLTYTLYTLYTLSDLKAFSDCMLKDLPYHRLLGMVR